MKGSVGVGGSRRRQQCLFDAPQQALFLEWGGWGQIWGVEKEEQLLVHKLSPPVN